jgi:hypothetical protein
VSDELIGKGGTVRAAQVEVAVQVVDRQRDLAEQLRSAMSEISATVRRRQAAGGRPHPAARLR